MDIRHNITETQRLIEDTDAKIFAARRKHGPSAEVLTLQRERRFLVDRKLSLQKALDTQLEKSTLDAR